MSWQTYALCAQPEEDADDWDMAASLPARQHAVAVCSRCPVYERCLLDAKDKPPAGLIQAGFGWSWPSREPVDIETLRRFTRKKSA